MLRAAYVAVCKLRFSTVALRDVPPEQRPEVVRAIGEAWARWGRR